MNTVQDLERLANLLITKAETADALANESAKAKELDESERHRRRGDNARYFAQVCMDAAGKLKTKEKRQKFVPPTWEQVVDFIDSTMMEWPHQDALAWWTHFESVGWVIGKNKPMVDWHRAAQNGFANYKKHHPEPKSVFQGNLFSQDPAGWSAFLAESQLHYVEFRYAKDYVKNDFYAARKPPRQTAAEAQDRLERRLK